MRSCAPQSHLRQTLWLALVLIFLALAGSTEVDGDVHSNTEFDSELDAALNGTIPSVEDLARIVGGYQPYRNRYRSFVRIDRGSRLHCGGVLISPLVVLTAAHCVSAYDSYTAYVNAYNTFSSYAGMEVRSVAKAIRHPRYNTRTREFDFGLMKLSSLVYGIPAMPLNGLSYMPSTGMSMTVIGIGDAAEGAGSTVWLNAAEVKMTDPFRCNLNYGDNSIRDITMFCARDPGQDSCQGDSGGPIMMNVNGVEKVVGIVSWGRGCAEATYPGVYARVSAGKPWIDTVLNRMYRRYSVPKRTSLDIHSGLLNQDIPAQPTTSCSDDSSASFAINGIKNLNCAFLRANPQVKACFPGQAAYTACPATCNSCVRSSDRSAGDANVDTPPDVVTFCLDSDTEEFHLSNVQRSCVWLLLRPTVQADICNPDHDAWTICPETCGSCSEDGDNDDFGEDLGDGADDCRDGEGTLMMEDTMQTCLWLSQRPDVQGRVCPTNELVRDICRATCNACG
ncbi:peptidase [Fragilaria crotonensis]|nr:peptidase [Fragilaria crotonensis]